MKHAFTLTGDKTPPRYEGEKEFSPNLKGGSLMAKQRTLDFNWTLRYESSNVNCA